MAILDIKLYGDKILRKKAEPVKEIDAEIIDLVENMVTTMYAARGIGLAAPQVGVPWRIIIIDVNTGEDSCNDRLILINPEIVEQEGILEEEEGCLSIPGVIAKVKRVDKLVVKGLDIKGNSVKISASQLLSRAILHEIDHLNGVLFIDHLSFLQKLLLRNQLNDVKKKRKTNR